jgi:hypothetical protein
MVEGDYGETLMGENDEGKLSERRSLIKTHKSGWDGSVGCNARVFVGIVEVNVGDDR